MAKLGEFTKGIIKENPTFVLMLGLCPTLAVTTKVQNAVAMGAAVIGVLTCSNIIVSLLRRFIPKEIRIPCFIVVIASFVTITELVMKAYAPEEINRALGIFIPLIVVNCIILGRAESYASKTRPLKAIINALGMGGGFTLALLCLGTVREVLGNGTLFGIELFGTQFQPWVVMILPPGGFFVLGTWLLIFAWVRQRRERSQLQAEAAGGN